MRNSLTLEARIQLLDAGARLLSAGDFLRAHESFEGLWRDASRQSERDIWQGLAQIAAALVKHMEAEPTTAITLLAKAEARLMGTPLLRLSIPALKAWVDALADPVTRGTNLPDASLPGEVLATLRSILAAHGDGAPDGNSS